MLDLNTPREQGVSPDCDTLQQMKLQLVPQITRQWRRRWFLSALGGTGLWSWVAGQEALAARPVRSTAPMARQPRSWGALLDHLIPADEWTPSATQVRLDRRLWDEARQDDHYRQLVVFGCEWMDRYHPDGFSGLLEDEREQLITWMSQAPWESPQRRFFELVRDHAMTLYYALPEARKGSVLELPPQPHGRRIDRPEALVFLRKES